MSVWPADLENGDWKMLPNLTLLGESRNEKRILILHFSEYAEKLVYSLKYRLFVIITLLWKPKNGGKNNLVSNVFKCINVQCNTILIIVLLVLLH